jgi:hypothetical protein
MDPIVSKVTTSLPDASSSDTGSQPGKSGASKFDQIKNQLKDNAASEGSSTQSTSPVNASAPGDASNGDRLHRGAAVSAPDRVRENLAASQHQLTRLKDRISTTPEAGSAQGIQGRLASVERQYTQLDSAVKSLSPSSSPQQLLALQQQVYNMNENISTLSKLVSQASSGVKSILQTQV